MKPHFDAIHIIHTNHNDNDNDDWLLLHRYVWDQFFGFSKTKEATQIFNEGL